MQFKLHIFLHDPRHLGDDQQVIRFVKHIHHRLSDLVHLHPPTRLISSNVPERLNLDPFLTQAGLDRETVDPLEPFVRAHPELAGLGHHASRLFGLLRQFPQLLDQGAESREKPAAAGWLRLLRLPEQRPQPAPDFLEAMFPSANSSERFLPTMSFSSVCKWRNAAVQRSASSGFVWIPLNRVEEISYAFSLLWIVL